MKHFRLVALVVSSIFLLFVSYFSIPLHVSGQLTVTPDDISIDMTPSNPGPNQKTLIVINSFAMDLNSATVTWFVNGAKVLSGEGAKQFSITTGAIGQRTNIDIRISSITGDIDKTFSIVPASIDLIWEADTYVPPFFKGKPLFTDQSTITFIALPHMLRNGVEVNPANLIYKWSENDTVLGDRSGYGQNTLAIVGSMIPRPMDITVEATDPVTGGVADGESVVQPNTPFVLMYKNDPLYGIQYEKALQNSYPLTEKEVDLTVVPYYFSAESPTDTNLSYDWQINGDPINDGQNSPDKVFRQVGDAYGVSDISVSVSQTQTLFQTAEQNIQIDFQKPTGQSSL